MDDGTVVELKDGPEIFSFNGEKIIAKKISHAWKRNSPKNMIRINLASGDEVVVTPEHPFYIANESFRGWKPAGEINETDFVLVPAKIPQHCEHGIPAFKERIIERLAKTDSFVVFIDDYGGKEFFERLSHSNLMELRKNGFFSTNPYSCRGERRFRLRDFLALCRLFGFSRSYAYDAIHSIKNASPKWRAGHTSSKMLLPKTLEDFIKLAYAVGCIQGDGSMYKKIAKLHNNDADIQMAYCSCLKDVFGISSKVVRGHTCQMVVSNGSLTLGRFLTECLSIPFQDKSASISLPDLFCLNREILAAFIRGWFDTDGYVSPFNNSIEITSKSAEIVRRVAAALLSFGILSSVYRKGIYWNIRIANKPYTQMFLDKIGSNSRFKRERMVEAVKKGETSRIFDIVPLSAGAVMGKTCLSNEILPYASRYSQYAHLSRNTLAKVIAASKQQVCDAVYVEESIRFVKIRKKEIIESPSEFVYDFSVPGTKNFVAERMVLHNTSLLDSIRSTNVAKKEAGAITQHIGASEISLEDIRNSCAAATGGKLPPFTIPGLLFIDTPGHESFTHLRERGGSIADIAVLVVDIMQGFQPQTIESIRILREFKTPFIVAANKVDLVSGWRSRTDAQGVCSVLSNISSQPEHAQARLDELLYGIVGKLSERGIESERFDRVTDFTKQVAIIPVSAKTGEGLPELLLSIAGLSQKFLEASLKTEVNGIGKGSILEVKEEKGLGTTIDVIIYDGTLRKNDEIIFATLNGPAKARVRGLLKPNLHPTGDGDKYEYVDEVHAAAGIKIYSPGVEGALSGSPLVVDDGNPQTDQLAEMNNMLKNILFESETNGAIVKADTLGSLEALCKLLSSQHVEIRRASIGKVTKKDVSDASVVAAADSHMGVVLSFNVDVQDDAADEAARRGVKVFSSKVIYSLCDDYVSWLAEEKKKAAGNAVERLPLPAKLRALPGCTFRASKPAILGVEIIEGRLKKGARLMDRKGEIVGEVREIQKDGKPVKETHAGEQLAISIEGAVCGKNVCEGSDYYVYITRDEGKELLSDAALPPGELAILDEILAITDAKRI